MTRPGLLLTLLPVAAGASPWTFGPAVPVTAAGGEGVFHHLESAGRKNVAVSGETVAVTWEDNRDATPGVYVSFSEREGGSFSRERQVSGPGEAYEPSVAAVGDGWFLIGWEEDGQAWLRLVSHVETGTPLRLGEGGQVSVAAGSDRAYVAWSGVADRFPRILVTTVRPRGLELERVEGPCPADPESPAAEQLYPSVVSPAGRSAVVAWEDRRPGHTVILAGRAEDGCRFTLPRRINELPQTRSVPFGRGTGAGRVALASVGAGGVVAVWADKRDFRTGYDIYAARSDDGGLGFAGNHRVQDDFGDLTEQWHPAIAARPGAAVVVAWDDDRDGSSDIWLSWALDGKWSNDVAVPGASGPGEQVHPSIALDAEGYLHLVWIEREGASGVTALRYSRGAWATSPGEAAP